MTNEQISKEIQMTEPKPKYDIYDRAFGFAVRAGRLINQLSKNLVVYEYGRQLIKASGSIGANIEEADGALTKKDFINKMGIARREARESRHWLTLIKAVDSTGSGNLEELDRLIQESKEIMLILSSIILKSQRNSKE